MSPKIHDMDQLKKDANEIIEYLYDIIRKIPLRKTKEEINSLIRQAALRINHFKSNHECDHGILNRALISIEELNGIKKCEDERRLQNAREDISKISFIISLAKNWNETQSRT